MFKHKSAKQPQQQNGPLVITACSDVDRNAAGAAAFDDSFEEAETPRNPSPGPTAAKQAKSLDDGAANTAAPPDELRRRISRARANS